LPTNRGIARWGEVFDDPVVAAAMLDRLLHRSTVLAIDGDSYRMRSRRERIERPGSQGGEFRRATLGNFGERHHRRSPS
jgi:hypothetical protein